MNARRFEQKFPVLAKDCNQCNRRCKMMPEVALSGGQFIVACLCGSVTQDDSLAAIRMWNGLNPIKRVMTRDQVEARKKAIADLKK